MKQSKDYDPIIVDYYNDLLNIRERKDLEDRLKTEPELKQAFEEFGQFFKLAEEIRIVETEESFERMNRITELVKKEQSEQLSGSEQQELQAMAQYEDVDFFREAEQERRTDAVEEDLPGRQSDEEPPTHAASVRSILQRRWLPVMSAAATVLLIIAAVMWIPKGNGLSDEKIISELPKTLSKRGVAGWASGIDSPDSASLEDLVYAGAYGIAAERIDELQLVQPLTKRVRLETHILIGIGKYQEAFDFIKANPPAPSSTDPIGSAHDQLAYRHHLGFSAWTTGNLDLAKECLSEVVENYEAVGYDLQLADAAVELLNDINGKNE